MSLDYFWVKRLVSEGENSSFHLFLGCVSNSVCRFGTHPFSGLDQLRLNRRRPVEERSLPWWSGPNANQQSVWILTSLLWLCRRLNGEFWIMPTLPLHLMSVLASFTGVTEMSPSPASHAAASSPRRAQTWRQLLGRFTTGRAERGFSVQMRASTSQQWMAVQLHFLHACDVCVCVLMSVFMCVWVYARGWGGKCRRGRSPLASTINYNLFHHLFF